MRLFVRLLTESARDRSAIAIVPPPVRSLRRESSTHRSTDAPPPELQPPRTQRPPPPRFSSPPLRPRCALSPGLSPTRRRASSTPPRRRVPACARRAPKRSTPRSRVARTSRRARCFATSASAGCAPEERAEDHRSDARVHLDRRTSRRVVNDDDVLDSPARSNEMTTERSVLGEARTTGEGHDAASARAHGRIASSMRASSGPDATRNVSPARSSTTQCATVRRSAARKTSCAGCASVLGNTATSRIPAAASRRSTSARSTDFFQRETHLLTVRLEGPRERRPRPPRRPLRAFFGAWMSRRITESVRRTSALEEPRALCILVHPPHFRFEIRWEPR